MTVFLVGCNGCAGTRAAPSAASSTAVVGAMRTVIFEGMCDASGAVSISDRTFAVADDEDNVLRVYDADRGGPPIAAVDVSDDLDLRRKRGRKAKKARARAPETDIEGATRLGDRAVWITSHGRSSSGKHQPERLRFFATPLPDAREPTRLHGAPYSLLLEDLAADSRMSPFDLSRAATLAPKAPGGLNIEGLTATPDGQLLIGFRNPVPNNHALVIPLENPEDVFAGGTARFGPPQLLDLGGLGIRSLSWWRGRYLIVAGPIDDGIEPRLYTWDGTSPPRLVEGVGFPAFNPEGFFSPEERVEILLLSDDGGVIIDAVACKDLRDPARKRFRGAWVRLPADGTAPRGSQAGGP